MLLIMVLRRKTIFLNRRCGRAPEQSEGRDKRFKKIRLLSFETKIKNLWTSHRQKFYLNRIYLLAPIIYGFIKLNILKKYCQDLNIYCKYLALFSLCSSNVLLKTVSPLGFDKKKL